MDLKPLEISGVPRDSTETSTQLMNLQQINLQFNFIYHRILGNGPLDLAWGKRPLNEKKPRRGRDDLQLIVKRDKHGNAQLPQIDQLQTVKKLHARNMILSYLVTNEESHYQEGVLPL